ncbi:MAG: MG2 domain-containing protein [Bacteroidota bacterium]
MKKILIVSLVALLFFPYCSNTVKVSRSSFKSVVPLGGNIKFTFNQDVVPDDKLNIWDTTQYIVFEPAIYGKFKWKTKRELVFSPYHFLRPATGYKAKFNDDIPGLIIEDNESLNFHTPYLELERFSAYYAKIPLYKKEPVIRYDLKFNYKIRPADLKKNLIVKFDGKETDFELLGHEHSDKVSLYLSDVSTDDESHNAEIYIKRGLNISNITVSKSDIKESTKILDPNDFKIDKVKAKHDGFTGTLTVTATQDVLGTNIRNFIEILPKVNYTVTVKGHEIIIKSDDFDVSKTYVLNLKKGLSGTLGGKLEYEFTEEISFGKLKPEIKILNPKAEYLSAKGYKNIEVRIVSVPEVRVRISKVYKNNLISYLSNSRSYNYDNYYYDDYYSSSARDVGNFGDVVWEKTLKTTDLPKSNSTRLFNFTFQDKVAHLEGLYVLEIKSKNDYWVKSRKIVSISDIGLIAKQGKDNIMIFANSIKTAKPLSNVKIEVTGKNNQSLGTVNTNNEGFAIFNMKEFPVSGFEPAMITAKLNNDFNFLPYNKTRVGTSRFEIGGRSDNLAGYDAFIYGDRDIYRPGETVHISTIIRDENWKVPGQIPVKLKFIAPNGKVFTTMKKTLNKHGSFVADIKLSTSAPTGGYSAEVYTSTGVYLNSSSIKVEEFVPDRIKVVAKANRKDIFLNEPLILGLRVNNLFGPPAVNRKYEIQQSIKRKFFNAKDYRSYNFSIKGGKTYFRSNVRTGKTNTQGMASENYKFSTNYSNMGVLQSDYFITVFDETGRPVNRKLTVDIYTQKLFYGINIPDYYNKTNRMMKIPLIAVGKNGKALNGVQAQVKLIKHEYRTVLTKSGSYYRYKSEHEEIIKHNKTIVLNGDKTVFNFTPKSSGKYEVRISKPGTKTYVSSSFYAYGWGSTTNSSFQVNTEGNIDIELDKEKYQVGDKAKVILKTPFSGKVLVTVERKNVTRHFYLNTDKRAVSFDLDIKEDFVPNVYVSATLIKAHDVSDIPLTVAHGYVPVMVENPANELPVSISSVKKSHSKTKQRITVKSTPNTAVTVAVVDEGILQVTGFSSPDPYRFFYRKRALAVKSYDIYPFLFPEIALKTGKEGGGAGGLGKRVNPMTNKRFKLVSFWSGILTTDKSGFAYYDVNIPQFSGDLRIMAVAYKDKAFGASTNNMKVADPIVISAALPRFLSPKDTVEMSITLSNTTAKATNSVVNVITTGKLNVKGEKKQTIRLEANSEKQIYLKLVTDPVIGQANVKISVNADGKTYTNETDISVRPASPLQKISGSGAVAGGASAKTNMDLSRFMKQSIDNKLIISKSPLVEFADDLDYLIGYPYGCVEQTVSKAFPQLYYNELAKEITGQAGFNPNYNIKEAIRKLQLMQLYNGAMSYWPGHGRETWWGSIFAAHFLIEAKKAGYEVDQSMVDKLYDYMKMKLKKRKTITYWFNGAKNKKIAPKEVAYSLYVMALAGKPRVSTMNYYKSRRELLSLDSKYLLASAYALSGDKEKYKQILPPAFEGELSKPVFGGSFHSPIRDEAIALNALLEVDPDNQQIGIMARHLSDKMKKRRYMNTQERVFAFLAMGKIARDATKSKVSAKIFSGNKQIAKYETGTVTLKTDKLAGGDISIDTKGKGKLYYFWDAEGIAFDGSYIQEDNFMKVRKTFYNRNGQVLTGNSFKQNDLIVIRLSIVGTSSTSIDNVVISDILPAGFEIENPRISSVPGMNWIKNKSYPVYQDVRDDRINLFVTVNNKARHYYYIVRAVTPGVFQMGPVGADAMYNGEYHSYHGGGVIRIER